MVGKRTDQVGRTESNAELVSDDAMTFDKISQAINSSEDLVVECLASGALPSLRAVVPILVVPSDVLWQVDYDQNGNITTPARRVAEATLFIDHSWGTPSPRSDIFRSRHRADNVYPAPNSLPVLEQFH